MEGRFAGGSFFFLAHGYKGFPSAAGLSSFGLFTYRLSPSSSFLSHIPLFRCWVLLRSVLLLLLSSWALPVHLLGFSCGFFLFLFGVLAMGGSFFSFFL